MIFRVLQADSAANILMRKLAVNAAGLKLPTRETGPISNADSHGQYAARKHGTVLEWLAERRLWTFHCTPTSCVWMKAIESFFGKLARRRLRRGVYKSVEQLEKAIMEFIELHNGREAKAFKLTASPERLIAARQRGIQVI